MITFPGKEHLRLDKDNTQLLKDDLTGCELLLHLKDDTIFSKYATAFDMNDWKKSWKRNTEGNPLLNCYLIELIEGGEFSKSKYEAVVLNAEGDEIVGWSHVVVDSKGRGPDSFGEVIYIKAFGFSSLNTEIVNTGRHNNDFLTSTDDFHLMILEKCSLDTLAHLRRMFELCPAARVYNSFKIDSANSKRIQTIIEKYEEIIYDLQELRIEEQATPRTSIFSGRKKKYSEVTHWQENNLRMKVRELRKEQFINVRGFFLLEDFWFDRIRPHVMNDKVEIAINEELIFSNYKVAERDSLAEGDLFVKVIRKTDTPDVLYRFLLELVIIKTGNNIYNYGKKYDEVLYSLCVNLDEKKFDYMSFMTI